jgi:predicted acyl esterase
MSDFRSEIREGMRIDWDVSIGMDDGLVLRADVYRPTGTGKHPAILSYGPYGKWLHFEDLYTDQWRRMIEQHPDVPAGSTNKYPGGPGAGLGVLGAVFTGVGPFQHNDPRDRPPEIFGRNATVHCGPGRQSHVLLPIVPPKG